MGSRWPWRALGRAPARSAGLGEDQGDPIPRLGGQLMADVLVRHEDLEVAPVRLRAGRDRGLIGPDLGEPILGRETAAVLVVEYLDLGSSFGRRELVELGKRGFAIEGPVAALFEIADLGASY